MRALQFWILLLGSLFVSLLLVKQIFLSRDLNHEQRQLVDSQETVSQGSAYENGWKQLAIEIYQDSAHDPALAQILKDENVGIHTNPTTGPGSTSAPPASSKAPVAPPHPATP